MFNFPGPPKYLVVAAVVAGVIYFLTLRSKSPVRKVPHEYFKRLWIWPPGSHTRWEAEVDASVAGTDKTVGMHSEALHDQVSTEGPTEAEVAFCKRQIGDLNGLFELTRPAIAEGWKQWAEGEIPQDWATVLTLDGFSVPKDGNVSEPWGVTWYCEPAGHYFSIDVRGGRPTLSSNDG